jgi:hypothetical protein
MPDSGGTKALVATAGAYPKTTEREVERRAEDQAGNAGVEAPGSAMRSVRKLTGLRVIDAENSRFTSALTGRCMRKNNDMSKRLFG